LPAKYGGDVTTRATDDGCTRSIEPGVAQVDLVDHAGRPHVGVGRQTGGRTACRTPRQSWFSRRETPKADVAVGRRRRVALWPLATLSLLPCRPALRERA
jgi:hypothetical protein